MKSLGWLLLVTVSSALGTVKDKFDKWVLSTFGCVSFGGRSSTVGFGLLDFKTSETITCF